jgi:methyltransferase-like protein
MIPISKGVIEPIIKTNIEYVDCIEDFEKIELQPNETILRFDNNQSCFYVRERDKFGDYQPIKIYFYEDFKQKVQNLEREEFIHKCQKVGLDDIKTEIACMFFLDNKKPYDVWIWAINEKGIDWEWDYVRNLKCRLKLKLFKKVI